MACQHQLWLNQDSVDFGCAQLPDANQLLCFQTYRKHSSLLANRKDPAPTDCSIAEVTFPRVLAQVRTMTLKCLGVHFGMPQTNILLPDGNKLILIDKFNPGYWKR